MNRGPRHPFEPDPGEHPRRRRRGWEHRHGPWGHHGADWQHGWHGPQWRELRRTWRLRHYLRARLHRRLFAWFFVAILVTGAATVATFLAAWRKEVPSWQKQSEFLRRYAGAQFAAVWDDPTRRDALAGDLAQQLGLQVALVDPHGSLLRSVGLCTHPQYTLPVQRAGTSLGEVRLCAERHHGFSPTTFLPLGFALLFLWGASGMIARRLTRPIADLAQVAHDLGAGRLSSRPNLECFDHGEVRVLAEAMNDMAERIEKQLRDQRELLAAVSHELRTPLGHIRLLAELARSGAEHTKPLDDLDAEVVEMDALVGQLLASARLDFASLTFTALDATEVGKRALERAGQAETVLRVETPETGFSGDATLVSRAVSNLVDNARKHGRGVARLVVGGRPGFVSFAVEDDGPGFAPGEEEQAFEPFYRKAKGTSAPLGTGSEREVSLGLGLHLVKRTAEAHGGTVFAGNRPEGGARVGFELPLASAARGSAAS